MKRNFAKVLVYVEDCNDHSPTFLRPSYEATISQQAPPGSQVVQVKALDKDVGSNAEISYSIVTGEHQPEVLFGPGFFTQLLKWKQEVDEIKALALLPLLGTAVIPSKIWTIGTPQL